MSSVPTVAFSEFLAFARCLWAFSVAGQEGHTSQRSSTLVAFVS